MLQTAFGASWVNRASVFERHKRFKEGRESVRDDERCGRSKEVRTPELIGQIKNFIDKDRRMSTYTISAQFDVSVGKVWTIGRVRNCLDAHLGQIICDKDGVVLSWWKCHYPNLNSAGLFRQNLFLDSFKTST